jgi:hypothetical protein
MWLDTETPARWLPAGVRADVMCDEPARSVTPQPEVGNALAPVLVDHVRELLAVKLVSACQRDYTAWIQRELCKARNWRTVDVVQAWHQELDRRNHARAFVVSSTERCAA